MTLRRFVLALALAASVSCYGTALLTHAGESGAFEATAMVDGEQIVVKGIGGRLYVDGKDYGPVRHGDEIEVDKAGNVFVNGARRWSR